MKTQKQTTEKITLSYMAKNLFWLWLLITVPVFPLLWFLLNPWVAIVFEWILSIALFSIFIYCHANYNGRNGVRWAAAFFFFSPIFAGMVYLLTWPSGTDRKQ